MKLISFGDTTPKGYENAPDADIGDLRWQNAWPLNSVTSLYVEHRLSRCNLHQIRDFMTASYNVLVDGGHLRVVEVDFANPNLGYISYVAGLNPVTRFDFGNMSGFLAGAGFLVRGTEYHDSFGQFHCDLRALKSKGLPARSRFRDSRGADPALQYSSLVVDAYKSAVSRSEAYVGRVPRHLAVGDSHTRFLAGKDNIENGETVPHARSYSGFAAHFDALHLGPGLAYNLDRAGSQTRILERVNALIDTDAINGERVVVFSFGEIDCRSHVVKQTQRQNRSIEDIVGEICKSYANFLDMMVRRGIRPAVWGPVASTPNQAYADPDAPAYGTIGQRNHAIACFNREMRYICDRRGYGFLTLADKLIDSSGQTIKDYYCDDIHLSQRARPFLWSLMPHGEIAVSAAPPAPVNISVDPGSTMG